MCFSSLILRTVIFAAYIALFCSSIADAQSNNIPSARYGVIIGDPLGITIQCRLSPAQLLDVGFGPDYFGSPRLQIDYLVQFDPFRSNVVQPYFGPGLAVAFAKGVTMFFSREPHRETFADEEDKHFGFGGRAIFGLDITPHASHMQYFIEAGPMIAMTRIFDLDLDGAIGLRFSL